MNDNFDLVLLNYGIREFSINMTQTNSYNQHYEIKANNIRYDLRANRKPLSYNNLLYEFELLEYLNKNFSCRVPQIIKTEIGTVCSVQDDVFYTLFKWLAHGPKVVKQQYGLNNIVSAARTLACLHNCLKNCDLKTSREDNIVFYTIDSWKDNFFPALMNNIIPTQTHGKDLEQLTLKLNNLLNSIDLANLPVGINHGDYKPCNVLFDKNNVDIIYDFDCAHMDYFLNDIACAILSFSKMDRLPSFNFEILEIFLRAYNSVRKLTKKELNLLPVFLCWKLIKDIVVFFEFNNYWWDETYLVIIQIYNEISKFEQNIKSILNY